MNHTIHEIFGPEFYKKHAHVFGRARLSRVALCGSTAAALCRGNKDYVPKDIDFVTGCYQAASDFTGSLQGLLLSLEHAHYRVAVNSKNKFCPPPSTCHFRITSSVWLPICLFVIPPERFRFFYGPKGTPIQLIEDVKKAAEEIEKIDGKPRLAAHDGPDWEKLPLEAQRADPYNGEDF